MAEFPALPLWTDAYLADTTHLSTVEHGAYLLLLMTAWRAPNCRLPDDDAYLARVCRCSVRVWAKLRPVMLQFWRVENGWWVQKRLEKERNFVEKVRAKRRAAAQAKHRKDKEKRSTHAGAHGVHPHPHLLDSESTRALESSTPNRVATAPGGAKGPSANPSEAEPNGHAEPRIEPRIEPAKAALWREMKGQIGGKPNRAGALVARWCRDFGEGAVFQAHFAAMGNPPADYVPWMEKRLKSTARARDGPKPGFDYGKLMAWAKGQDDGEGGNQAGADEADGGDNPAGGPVVKH